MKTTSFNIFLAAVLFLSIAALTSCKDDDVIPSVNPSESSNPTVLKRTNSFYNFDVSNSSGWKVEKYPEWIGLMNKEGAAGEKLQIFVEENDDDLDRRDTIVVALNNTTEKVLLPLLQYGIAHSGENDGANLLTDEDDLWLTYGVGYSMDVIDINNNNGMKYNVFDVSPFNYYNLLNAIKEMGEADGAFSEPLYSSRYESVTGTSTTGISNQLGVNAGIDVGIKAFKFSVEAGYSSSSASDSKYMYALQEIQHIVGSHYIRGALMRHLALTNPDVMQSSFKKKVEKLKDNANDTAALAYLVKNYGTHIITRGTLGGELKVSMKMKITDQTDASCIHAALGLSSKVVNVGGEFNMSNKENAIAENTTISLQSYGGNNIYSISPKTTFKQFQDTVRSVVKMKEWVSSIKKKTSLALIDIETIPLWDLMPNEKIRESLRNYIVGEYQRQVFEKQNQTFVPDLHQVRGYGIADAPGYGSIYLPDIDVEIQAESTIIPELDADEFSTVIYSGPKDNVNRTRGFFVGSKTRKPCKIRFAKDGSVARKDDGSLDVEVFGRLTEASITQLYVDATGDVTIATKSVDNMYINDSISNWKNDISKLKKAWTAKSDLTITGTTDYPITIADGVTLTLDGVTVNNQIICQGGAKIVLKDGTTNVVKCSTTDKAGIQAGPTGKTLTISGNGQLEVTSSDNGAAIGSSANSKCGHIKIDGGTITATSGSHAAAIGSGNGGTCGKIGITKNVTAVKATCGKGETCVPIGAGDNGTCGTVTIDDKANVEQINPNAKPLNLDDLTENYTITSNSKISGTTSHPIYIADGVTVVMNGATINASVICNGNATIELEANTENLIKITTDYTNALRCGGAGTTLTITGNGKLEVNSTSRDMAAIGGGEGNILITGGTIIAKGGSGGAGIGAGRTGKTGNIKITGGDITATGGEDAAGIGTGDYWYYTTGDVSSICGDIEITGGTITATGGSLGAGIGTGRKSTCGNIIIRKSVTKVTATKGAYAASIGAGDGGKCGTINIENGANVIQN